MLWEAWIESLMEDYTTSSEADRGCILEALYERYYELGDLLNELTNAPVEVK